MEGILEQSSKVLITLSKVKEFFKERGLRTSAESLEALNAEVKKFCLKAGDKALADKLKTVKRSHIES